MKKTLFSLIVTGLVCFHSSFADDSAEDKAKTLADAAKSSAEASKIKLTAPLEAEKLKSEVAKNYADAMKLISESHLNEAKTAQIYLEMERLRQRMRITEYEFQRIIKADYDMHSEMTFINAHLNLIRSLMLGYSNWKTWSALEVLMVNTGDADIIVQVMFDIKIDALPSNEFVSNEFGMFTEGFPGGNLGELYTFVQRHDYSFRKFGAAHKAIMKVVAMMSKSAELKIKELQDINQSIRLTIAKID